MTRERLARAIRVPTATFPTTRRAHSDDVAGHSDRPHDTFDHSATGLTTVIGDVTGNLALRVVTLIAFGRSVRSRLYVLSLVFKWW